uniref:terminase small subunit n=1 Tax=Tateyamaria pelophila TaxID=328415 RepID=UPI002958D05C|nr:terminase small subunit [Tateyamaria pelophila]
MSYFDWATENPLQEDRVFSHQGEQTHESVSLLRAFTLSGLWLHLGITEKTWRAWRRDRPDLKEVITKAEADEVDGSCSARRRNAP